ncbi:MAG: WD40 repeat protein [Crocinitomicaceae bacterium]|jgi:WD40 repeat protein
MNFRKQKEISGHAGAIYACTCSEGLVYTGSTDKHVARWLIEEGIQDKFAIKFEQSVYALEIIENNFLIIGLSNGDLHVVDLEKGEEVHYFTQHKKAIFSITWNKLANQMMVGDADGNLSIWNAETFKLLIYLPLEVGKIRDVALSHDGQQFALACQDGTIRIFESAHFNELKTLNGHKDGTTSVIFHPLNPNQLISGGKDALLKLWDLEKEEVLKEIPAHNYAIYSIISLNEGKNFATSSRDKTIKTWTSDLEFIERLDLKVGGHKHSVNKLRKLDEETFVSVSDDKRVIVWAKD